MKRIIFSIVTSMAISGTLAFAQDHSQAERGEQFYQFEDTNTTENSNTKHKSNIKDSKNNNIGNILKELLEVAKEQRDIQQKIFDLLSEEINPTPQKVVIDGVECIANSSSDCFVMPLTKDAKRIPVLKKMLVNPTPETARDYLQWQAKYLTTGPFKVGRSFQYAMNTYGEEAYPMNINRGALNSNTGIIDGKRTRLRNKLINKKYSDGSLGLFIFLSNGSLDYFAIKQISEMLSSVDNKKAITLVFKTQKEADDFMQAANSISDIKKSLENASVLINSKSHEVNHIYMTPTYMAVSKVGKDSKKQAVALGRVGNDGLNTKIYEWLEQENIIKRGGLSDYRVWDNKKDKK